VYRADRLFNQYIISVSVPRHCECSVVRVRAQLRSVFVYFRDVGHTSIILVLCFAYYSRPVARVPDHLKVFWRRSRAVKLGGYVGLRERFRLPRWRQIHFFAFWHFYATFSGFGWQGGFYGVQLNPWKNPLHYEPAYVRYYVRDSCVDVTQRTSSINCVQEFLHCCLAVLLYFNHSLDAILPCNFIGRLFYNIVCRLEWSVLIIDLCAQLSCLTFPFFLVNFFSLTYFLCIFQHPCITSWPVCRTLQIVFATHSFWFNYRRLTLSISHFMASI